MARSLLTRNAPAALAVAGILFATQTAAAQKCYENGCDGLVPDRVLFWDDGQVSAHYTSRSDVADLDCDPGGDSKIIIRNRTGSSVEHENDTLVSAVLSAKLADRPIFIRIWNSPGQPCKVRYVSITE